MRYRQVNDQNRSSDQKAKDLIKNDDVLSTKEQEEVIAYFARSLRTSTQFLKVVVCLHAVVALVYVVLLLSGSFLFDLELDSVTSMKLAEVGRQLRSSAAPLVSAPVTAAAATAALTETTFAPTTADPVALMAKLDRGMRSADRQYARNYLERSGARLHHKSLTFTNVVSAALMLYSAALLMWAGWSGYLVCRLLRVNVEELTNTEPRELGSSLAALQKSQNNNNADSTSASAHGLPDAGKKKHAVWGLVRRLRQRMRADPPVTQYVIAAFAAVASCVWFCALLHRQLAMRRAYVDVGLPPPSVFAVRKVTDALLEYVLALWQPFFHLMIGRLLRSMLDTKENVVMLSRMKYRFDKV